LSVGAGRHTEDDVPIVGQSRVGRRFRVTIPAGVRGVLRLRRGDLVHFDVEGDRVTLRGDAGAEAAYLRGLEASLREWISPLDDEAYLGLGMERRRRPE
jgi:AbrB family looped-hinge helix DNA binding protein